MAYSETVTVDAWFVCDTGSAWGISVDDDPDEGNLIWLPKSQVELIKGSRGSVSKFDVPEWLAIDRGLA